MVGGPQALCQIWQWSMVQLWGFIMHKLYIVYLEIDVLMSETNPSMFKPVMLREQISDPEGHAPSSLKLPFSPSQQPSQEFVLKLTLAVRSSMSAFISSICLAWSIRSSSRPRIVSRCLFSFLFKASMVPFCLFEVSRRFSGSWRLMPPFRGGEAARGGSIGNFFRSW